MKIGRERWRLFFLRKARAVVGMKIISATSLSFLPLIWEISEGVRKNLFFLEQFLRNLLPTEAPCSSKVLFFKEVRGKIWRWIFDSFPSSFTFPRKNINESRMRCSPTQLRRKAANIFLQTSVFP